MGSFGPAAPCGVLNRTSRAGDGSYSAEKKNRAGIQPPLASLRRISATASWHLLRTGSPSGQTRTARLRASPALSLASVSRPSSARHRARLAQQLAVLTWPLG